MFTPLTPLHFLKKHAREALFSHFLMEEAWEFDDAERWMIAHATERPITTMILFKAVIWHYRTQHGHVPTDTVTPGLQLAGLYEQTEQQEDAIRILRFIWHIRTQHGYVPADAVTPGLQLAGLYEQTGQQEDAMEIRSAVQQRVSK
ncbi:hypothetical protein DDE83_001172 [Stemphylium lycopersici]|uniref:Uncharacterized protein n=1 Tax=Stemphylium lycopersici TaxID=183478 RepID=A0A364NEK9_STELY|nr:hypothetical protein DDE83_001172 [Stemphylium lycopersici]